MQTSAHKFWLGFCFLLGIGSFFFLLWGLNDVVAEPTAVFMVTTVNDSGSGSLRQAITGANNTPGADIIEFNLPANSTITLNGSQLPVITDTLTMDGSTAVSLTINGNNQSRILEIDNGTAVTITSLSLINGEVSSPSSTCPLYCGGGILVNNGANLVLNDVVFNNNSASNGGGIYIDHGTGTIVNSSFNENSANNDGGGIFSSYNSLTLTNTTFISNTANRGGAIHSFGVTRISGNRFENNIATYSGGGINNYNTLVIEDSSLRSRVISE